mgnify:CR=1 FL=1
MNHIYMLGLITNGECGSGSFISSGNIISR